METEQTSTKSSADEQPLMEHIRELRIRLIYSLVAIIIGACFSYTYAENIFYFLCKPYFESFPDSILIGTGPADAFLLKLKMAVVAGTLVSSPVIFYQFWLFIAPGLHKEEKYLLIPFLISSTTLLGIGIWFAYAVVLPFSFAFFYDQYTSIKITPTIRITEHISFTAKALISFGIVFELPILAYFLGRIGVVTSQMLISGVRYAIVVIFILSAIMTPPDVLTQFLMAGPLLILYGISILVVRFTERQARRQKKESQT